jgi:uncharacterized membrane protein HdeD (DUF308 family)
LATTLEAPEGVAPLFGPTAAHASGVRVSGSGEAPTVTATAEPLPANDSRGAPRPRLRPAKMPALVPSGWALVARGGAAAAVGAGAITARDTSRGALVALVAGYALADGASTLLAAARATRAAERWWPLALEGLVGVGLGAQVLLWRDVGEATLLYYVALWSLLSGVLELTAARRLREEVEGEWLLALRGLTAIGLGVSLLASRRTGAATLLAWLGPSATVFGALFVALGLRLRAWGSLPHYDRSRSVYSVDAGVVSLPSRVAAGAPREGTVGAGTVDPALRGVRRARANGDHPVARGAAPRQPYARGGGGTDSRPRGGLVVDPAF